MPDKKSFEGSHARHRLVDKRLKRIQQARLIARNNDTANLRQFDPETGRYVFYRHSPYKRRVMDMYHRGCGQKEMASMMNVPYRVIERTVDELVLEGKILYDSTDDLFDLH